MDAGYRLCQSGEFSELISPYIFVFATRREKSKAAQRLEIFEKFLLKIFHINQLKKLSIILVNSSAKHFASNKLNCVMIYDSKYPENTLNDRLLDDKTAGEILAHFILSRCGFLSAFHYFFYVLAG